MYPVLLHLGGATKDWGQMNSPHLRDLIPQISRDFPPPCLCYHACHLHMHVLKERASGLMESHDRKILVP